ncbi:MAG: hypothetical protein P8K68_08630 [Algibacter sp.]|uniref:DUF6920 family protein n=1 Tax=Algibacter sp. TaxID=1872428 RepID=UPI002616CC71|nr:DUF6544 family protein [Algibacter sp.]MDG1730358.1 hypothetical protein [Algibacter sp.]MDG2178836.1 hypothetical protein [Algibacter sp.]
MKLAFGVIILIHGIIHLLGFIKAFYSTEAPLQVLGISNPLGALWLITFIMFVASSASLFLNNKKWFYIAIVAVCISQILIITAWKEAKFGSIANVLILLFSLSAYGSFRFTQMVQKEGTTLLKSTTISTAKTITKKEIQQLPEIVQKWISNSGVTSKGNITSARLTQKGQLKTKPRGKWMPFSAQQYFNIQKPAFIWSAKINNNALIHTLGRDKYTDGKAEMLIKLQGLIPVVNEAENSKLNSASMQRFLSEMCWFPSAALNDYITWEAIDKTSAKAILTNQNQSVSGCFKFNSEGEILAFETERYFGGSENSKLEKWVVKILDYKTFDGLKVPNKCEVTWKLESGDYNWLKLEITDIAYNKAQLYENE